MDVVEKINEVRTARAGRMEDVPVNPVFIKKAYVAR
jgi:peptidyl-prolyl cis-trans isomerase A (cyclophilin A)/peptidyl-prolyl cis-trans isomerase B (cyclophilin B)